MTQPQPNYHTQLKLGGWQAWLVVLTSAMFFFYEFLQMNMFNTINAELMRDFQISGAQISNLSAAYFYADMLFVLPAGLLLDRFSTRKLLSIAMTISIVATVCLSFSTNYWLAFAMRLLSGFCAGFNLLSSMRLAARWFSNHQLALVAGVVVTMAMLGGLLAQTPMTILVDHVGWRNAVRYDATLGVLFLALIMTLVRDYPTGYIASHIEKLNRRSVAQTILFTLRNKQNWFSAFYTSFLNLPLMVLGALWGIQYLTQVNGFSRTEASMIDSMLFIGMIIGSPLLGWISDKIAQRKLMMIVGAVTSLLIILMIRYWQMPSFTGMLCLFFALGFTTSAQVLTYPLITESNPRALTASALGMASVIILAGGALFSTAHGLVARLALAWCKNKWNTNIFHCGL